MRDLALSIPTFGDPVRVPDHNACHPESFGTHERQPVLLPHSSYDRTRCKGFPTAAIFQLPGLSLVSDSRSLLLVRPLLWKITLPLKSIVRCTNANASASSNFLLWKWRNKSGNSPFNEAMRVCNAWVPHSSPVFGLEWDNEVPFDPPFCLSQIPSVSLSRAFGSGTISPIRTKSLRYVLLLPSPSIVHDEHQQADIRKRAGACPNQVRSLRLWVCGDAGAYSPAGWRTRTQVISRCSQIAKARCLPAIDRRVRALLANTLLRLQHPKSTTVWSEALLHSPQPRISCCSWWRWRAPCGFP